MLIIILTAVFLFPCELISLMVKNFSVCAGLAWHICIIRWQVAIRKSGLLPISLLFLVGPCTMHPFGVRLIRIPLRLCCFMNTIRSTGLIFWVFLVKIVVSRAPNVLNWVPIIWWLILPSKIWKQDQNCSGTDLDACSDMASVIQNSYSGIAWIFQMAPFTVKYIWITINWKMLSSYDDTLVWFRQCHCNQSDLYLIVPRLSRGIYSQWSLNEMFELYSWVCMSSPSLDFIMSVCNEVRNRSTQNSWRHYRHLVYHQRLIWS